MPTSRQPRTGQTVIRTKTVRAIKQTDTKTTVRMSDRTTLTLAPHVYIHCGDVLEIISNRAGDVLGVSKRVFDKHANRGSKVKIFPPYSVTRGIQIPPHKLNVTFLERTNPRDWQAAKLLEKFHYRGMGLGRIVGRRSVLLAKLEGVGIIGYGVVSASVLASKPRFRILRTNVGQLLKTKFINKLVRIPRIVIHPEFRGIGLGALMARELVEYVKERWDVKGYRPEMIEVIAAMTEYHRFFQAAGFLDAGYTEGYKGPGITPHYGSGSFAARQNTAKYKFMVNQGPKPYLVFPLNSKRRKQVESVFQNLRHEESILKREPLLDRSISFSDLSITYKAKNGLTPRAKLIKESFGVDSSQMNSAILQRFNLNIEPGDMVLLTGASGSGKSTIISALAHAKRTVRKLMRIEGHCPTVRKRIALLHTSYNGSRPLVDRVGQELHNAIKALNSVGLAEAHLYLKRPTQISEGQRYRFSVALLCESKKPIWIADEFASTLDPLNAAIVAKGLRKLSYQQGATCIIAAPHIAHFIDSLVPNVLVHLSWGGVARITGMRASARREGDKWLFRVRNCGLQDLNDISFVGVDHLGNCHSYGALPVLGPYRHTKFELPARELSEYRSIRITSKEHVGEIFYVA
jgi:uncharacterized protein